MLEPPQVEGYEIWKVFMYRKILVPLDRSRRAEAILPHVEDLALKYKAQVIFMKVIVPPFTPAPTRKSVEKQQKDFQLQKKRARDYLAERQYLFREKGIDAVTRVAHGPVVEEIFATAEREGVDLIAIASHGRGGLSRAFYGSVTAALLQRIDRPLLLIRSRSIQAK
jgi:nucleotide-binding universal stress UspA family protein